MNTEKNRHNHKNRMELFFAAILITAAVLGGMFLTYRSTQRNAFPLLKELSALSADRSVSPEEYGFFAELAAKDGLPTDEKSLREYIGLINAEFYLGSQMEVCEPFQYELLRYRTEAENKDRAMKKLTGQLYYGPDSYSEESYFEYIHSRLRSDMLSWLVARRDPDMVSAARKFFDRNEKRFTAIKTVTYELTQDGVTEEKILEDTMFRTMGQSDPTLMDALEKCEIGEVRVLKDGTGRSVKKLAVTTELTPFEEQEPYVVELWLNNEVLDRLFAAIADHTTLLF